jgi:MFS family permease
MQPVVTSTLRGVAALPGLRHFHPRSVPAVARPAYLRELLSWAFLPLFLGAIEGGALGVVVKKAFADAGVSPVELNFAVAVVTAAPNVANLTSFVWAGLARGRRKVPFIAWLQTVTAACVALIAAMPENRWGLWGLCALATLARVAWTGVITLRAAVWRANYPREARAHIAGNMATVQSLVLALSSWLLGAGMDLSPRSFHLLFPALAVLGIVGNVLWRRVPMRGEGRSLRAESFDAATAQGFGPASIVRTLRDDPPYARFMLWMSVFGLGNLMIGAPQAIMLEDELHATYTQGILATTVIPLLVMPLAIPFWARRLGRSHVVEFRAVHGWSFVAATAVLFAASLLRSMPLFYVAGALLGVGFAGGSLAWNIGHQDFAPPERDAQYMAVHVTLNGLRGLAAPFLAVGLYEGLKAWNLAPWTLFACTLVNVVGVWGFMRMRRERRHRAATLVAASA